MDITEAVISVEGGMPRLIYAMRTDPEIVENPFWGLFVTSEVILGGRGRRTYQRSW
jgi:hypothetical protein